MFGIEEERKEEYVAELLEQMETIYDGLRCEYLDMAKRYDEACKRVEDLEADKYDLEDRVVSLEKALRAALQGVFVPDCSLCANGGLA